MYGDTGLYKFYPVHVRQLTALYSINADTCTHMSLNDNCVDVLCNPTCFNPYRFIFRKYNGYIAATRFNKMN